MSTTPLDPGKRSNSRSRTSRPTTPLRPSSRSSFRESARGAGEHDAPFPLNAFEPAFAELSDAMADLEANMMHFQLMHESLARFSESFASFLYGLNMNAFCVDFPEGPVPESFRRDRTQPEQPAVTPSKSEADAEMTFIIHLLPPSLPNSPHQSLQNDNHVSLLLPVEEHRLGEDRLAVLDVAGLVDWPERAVEVSGEYYRDIDRNIPKRHLQCQKSSPAPMRPRILYPPFSVL
ncbi:DASH complex subunit DAM1 [Fusarium oxysporum f. sp. raphani 54005]|uniref:DASH complex subunit DAM1 n=6 Tax=Fusarium oxysporum TaxID=5507 RepID=W9JA16_FUSOX|nr:DASH complex subunit DAM1 [Fusarium oxysporum NRRL 32931]EWZ47579.1 DASH complex subunit DAM1 [Fusarium oxysporum Fo47]EWZ92628.1 DASH complex subunit DAM1 [Fusarium oxysporum f. sp. lycopersici MN25]EXA42833.1 DASH complex subunit DAM1 [Fusarium oxysporum f. sp. pisi HDV247]EXK44905.1 DASH complex subunit DAM1 [Fusarium oxysporum f. sp. melonis 26406]EXK97826.1 DASH complex subunit DAM1 [Fusarium oxysporum f. sp. raphani 54005]EXL52910.1 DASH complex subunit DAM1 [Fusarium oxysporum f. sp